LTIRISRVGWEQPEGLALREAAQQVQISLIGPPLEYPLDAPEYHRVIAAMAQAGAQALIVGGQPQNYENQQLIIELAEKGRLPAIFPFPDSCKLGGLIAYANDAVEATRHLADQIAQILKGASPADIPFYEPTKFVLAINLKTAKLLGLSLSPDFLSIASEVIE
jgi:putative ABC transport system substrate-binding protein